MSAPSRGDTVVGNDVWLGYRSLVMPGMTIGDGAIVAAGSVVAADVPPYAIAGGNPARVLRMRYDDADVDRLLRAGVVGLAGRARHRARADDHVRHARGARADRGGRGLLPPSS